MSLLIKLFYRLCARCGAYHDACSCNRKGACKKCGAYYDDCYCR